MTTQEKRCVNELLKKIAKSDENAYSLLYEKFYKIVYDFISTLGDTEGHIDDLTQQTFSRIWEKRRHFAGKLFYNGSAYMLQIAKNECNSYFRKENKWRSYIISLEVDYDEPITYTLNPDDFSEFWKGLNSAEIKLMHLRYVSGYSVKEIAKRTNVSTRTLNRKFTEIKNRLRKNLGVKRNEKANQR